MKKQLLIFLLLFIPFVTDGQVLKWAKSCNNVGSIGSGVMEATPAVVDKKGNIYQTGYINYSSGYQSSFGSFILTDYGSTDQQAILVSLDSVGSFRWVIGMQYNEGSFTKIVADPYGDVYVFGYLLSLGGFTMGSQSYSGGFYFVAKVDSDGNVLWIKDLAPGAVAIGTISINTTGHLYMSGYYHGLTYTCGGTVLHNADTTGAGYQGFFAKLDSGGHVIWAKNGPMTGFMNISNDSNIYVLSSFYTKVVIGSDTLISSYSGINYFVAKFDINGNPLWAKMDTRDTFGYLISAMALDEAGSSYVSGHFNTKFYLGPDSLIAGAPNQMFLYKYDSSGNAVWARTMDFTDCSDVESDQCGHIWICGNGYNNAFGIPDRMYIAEFDSGGHLEDTIILGAGGEDGAYLAHDNKGNLFVSGDFENSPFILNADTLNHNSSTGEALFLLKFLYDPVPCVAITDPEITNNSLPSMESRILILPNPATSDFTIYSESVPPPTSKAELYDLAGKLINTYPLAGNNTEISITNLPSGMYQCRIYTPNSSPITKKLIIMK